MKQRIHLVVDEAEKKRFQVAADREAMSLSAWLREAARARLERHESRSHLDSIDELRAFFDACDAREKGTEPDWDEHRSVIERSIRSGGGEP